jgi:hypothetical protein
MGLDSENLLINVKQEGSKQFIFESSSNQFTTASTPEGPLPHPSTAGGTVPTTLYPQPSSSPILPLEHPRSSITPEELPDWLLFSLLLRRGDLVAH